MGSNKWLEERTKTPAKKKKKEAGKNMFLKSSPLNTEKCTV